MRVYNEWESKFYSRLTLVENPPTNTVLRTVIVSGNSLERIQQYIDIEQEPEPKVGGTPPAYWPASGELQVEGLSARYSPVREVL